MILNIIALALMLQQFVLAVTIASSALYSRQAPATLPTFVTDYAPVVWLHSQEAYFPSDISSQLVHTSPEINFTVLEGYEKPLTLDNLATLNAFNASTVYLTSNDRITADPSMDPGWLTGVKPDVNTHGTAGATSLAVIVNDHGAGNVDVFYMYFYAFNWGGIVLGQDVDDHVGDWEHTMVRFFNGTPTAVWFSQHAFGEAFTYDCVEKQGLRPVVYSGNGSHANYATQGKHDHTIPGLNLPGQGILEDYTDQGTLWDPLLGAYFYRYDVTTNDFTAYNSSYPLSWLSYTSHWGDEQYPDSDPRQHKIFGINAAAEFTSGELQFRRPFAPYNMILSCETSNLARDICRKEDYESIVFHMGDHSLNPYPKETC